MDSAPYALGLFVTLSDPGVIELVGLAGFDFVIIDCEHGALSLETVQNHLRAARASRLGTLIRVPGSDPGFAQRVLDAGAEGILFPHVRSAADAAEAVAAVRYPPAGRRGMSTGSRAAAFGAYGLPGPKELTETFNRSLLATVMIEEPEAVEQIHEIVATPGLDAVYVGPSDLSAGMGLIGSHNHPDLAAAVELVESACRESGVRFGMPSDNQVLFRTPAELRAAGAWLIATGLDTGYLLQSLRQGVERMRA